MTDWQSDQAEGPLVQFPGYQLLQASCFQRPSFCILMFLPFRFLFPSWATLAYLNNARTNSKLDDIFNCHYAQQVLVPDTTHKFEIVIFVILLFYILKCFLNFCFSLLSALVIMLLAFVIETGKRDKTNT